MNFNLNPNHPVTHFTLAAITSGILVILWGGIYIGDWYEDHAFYLFRVFTEEGVLKY